MNTFKEWITSQPWVTNGIHANFDVIQALKDCWHVAYNARDAELAQAHAAEVEAALLKAADNLPTQAYSRDLQECYDIRDTIVVLIPEGNHLAHFEEQAFNRRDEAIIAHLSGIPHTLGKKMLDALAHALREARRDEAKWWSEWHVCDNETFGQGSRCDACKRLTELFDPAPQPGPSRGGEK